MSFVVAHCKVPISTGITGFYKYVVVETRSS